MSQPTPGQIMEHIRSYTRNPGCPFCRAYAKVSKREYREWLDEQTKKEAL